MDLATQPVTDKNRDAYYWRLLATAASFTLFGLGGLCLRLVVFPVSYTHLTLPTIYSV